MRNKRNRKPGRLAAALLAAIFLSGVCTPSAVWAESAEQVDEVREILESYHISSPEEDELNQAAIEAMVESLDDPYTEYYDAEEWESFASDLEQSFTGIGIVMVGEDGTVYVEDVIPGSPAEKAGILPGDAIVSADGQSVKGLSVSELQKKLLGKEGTTLKLGVSRDGKSLAFEVVRKALNLPSARAVMMGNGVGYIALTGFTSDAGDAFARELGELEKSGMTSLVIDLRDNGGGYVSAAQQIASLFIEDGVLAHLKDRSGKAVPLNASGGGKSYPVTVLVNGHTASASELLAGALQDYGIAKLVGTRTFGKGVVQSIFPLESGGVIKVTVQEYHTPKGRKVDKEGLAPDVAVEGDIPQLVKAFREAGGREVTAVMGKGVVLVNGVRTPFPNAAVSSGGTWHVNLRLAAALAGAEVGFDAKTKTITLTQGSTTRKLSAQDGSLINKNGWSLIELNAAKRLFPGLSSEVSGGQLKLSVR